ncbi:MAG: aldehyde dehydrogenase family protein [Myxococcota bacterium]|nr:aldehyde dehydrogenase family protein [Myxococcota bacterium]
MSAAAETEAPPRPHADLSAIPAAVARLRASFEAGRTRSLEWRREQISAVEKMLSERADDFLEALRADLGKPTLEALAMDLMATKNEAALARKKLRQWTRPERVGLLPIPGRMRIVREPLGVVLVISPWTYPV